MIFMNKMYTTQKEKEMQEMIKASSEYLWKKEIFTQLPKNISQIAKETYAIMRKRCIHEAEKLLQVLFIYALSGISLRMLPICGKTLGVADMSDTAWRKALMRSVDFLKYVLAYLLAKMTRPVTHKDEQSRNVHLIDSSSISQDGSAGNSIKIHTSYNLTEAHMDGVKITDHHTAEHFSHYNIEKNGIYIADSGYGKANLYQYIVSRKADCVLRFTPNHLRLVDADGVRIDIMTLLKTKQPVLEFCCFIKQEKSLYPVRIIASRLPEDKIEDAIRRKKRKASRNQTKKMKPETLEYAKWVIIATSLSAEYSKEEILHIYRSRWQVELLFKRIKQNLKIHTIRKGSEKYAAALVHLWLIIWAIVERQVLLFEAILAEKEISQKRYRIWDLCVLSFQRIYSIIMSGWASSLDVDCFKSSIKHLLTKSGKRVYQFAAYRLDVLPSLIV